MGSVALFVINLRIGEHSPTRVIRILLAEPHARVARTLRRGLFAAGKPVRMRPDDCRSARAALSRLRARRYDIVVVDLPLPDMDALEFGRSVRGMRSTRGCGLIMLAAPQASCAEECEALAAGFDDVIRKPFELQALQFRIFAVARRRSPQVPGAEQPPEQAAGSQPGSDVALQVEVDEPLAFVFGSPTPLTVLEWRILRTLSARRGCAVARSYLAHETWGVAPPARPQRALDQHVANLRAKLGSDAGSLVETVRGHGFRLAFWKDGP